jgi:hypothetical protein
VKVIRSPEAKVPPAVELSPNAAQPSTALLVLAVIVSCVVPLVAVVTDPLRTVRLELAVEGSVAFVVTGESASEPATSADKRIFVQGSLA